MPRRPNILVITTHDSGQHFGCYHAPTVHTPAIDRLAGEGVCLTGVLAAAPICSPSRAALMTGRWPQNTGVRGLVGAMGGLTDPRRHLSHILHEAGYFTAFFGAQHEVKDIGRLSFDLRDPPEDPDPLTVAYTATETAGNVAAFLHGQSSAHPPFFAQVGFFETHTPYDWKDCPPDESQGVRIPPYATMGAPELAETLRPHVAGLQGSLRRVDRAVETILDSLGAAGLADDTLVLFTTDHGPQLPRAKWTMYDPGLRVAAILRWPAGGLSRGVRIDRMLGNVDILPTLLELADVAAPDGLDGESFAGVLRGDLDTPTRETTYAVNAHGGNFAARTQRYKIIRNFRGVCFNERLPQVDSPRPAVELYDLAADPEERNDLAENPDYATVRADMDGRLWQWLADCDDPILGEQS